MVWKKQQEDKAIHVLHLSEGAVKLEKLESSSQAWTGRSFGTSEGDATTGAQKANGENSPQRSLSTNTSQTRSSLYAVHSE